LRAAKLTVNIVCGSADLFLHYLKLQVFWTCMQLYGQSVDPVNFIQVMF